MRARFFAFNLGWRPIEIGSLELPEGMSIHLSLKGKVPENAELMLLGDDRTLYFLGGNTFTRDQVGKLFGETTLGVQMDKSNTPAVHLLRSGRHFICLKIPYQVIPLSELGQSGPAGKPRLFQRG